MLGGAYKEVDTYNTEGGWLNFTENEINEDLLVMVESGWQKVKMKKGDPNPREDLERVCVVRSALPTDFDLMGDANQKWDLFTARRYIKELEGLNVAWLEEPLHSDDDLGHVALSQMGSVAITLGENVFSVDGFNDFLRADAVDIVQLDVTRSFGPLELM